MVSQDRHTDFIEAIQQGAPTAVQITDRYHLIKNLTDTLHRMFSGKGQELRTTANQMAEENRTPHAIQPQETSAIEETCPRRPAPQEKLLREVKRLAQAEYSNRQIAKMLPLHRNGGSLQRIGPCPGSRETKPFAAKNGASRTVKRSMAHT